MQVLKLFFVCVALPVLRSGSEDCGEGLVWVLIALVWSQFSFLTD